MTAEELIQRAKDFSEKNNVPITKNQFEGTVDDPVPPLPYMVYLTPHETGRRADGLNNLKAQEIVLNFTPWRMMKNGKDWRRRLKWKCCRMWSMTHIWPR